MGKQSANGQGWYAFDLGRERDVGGIAVRARPDSAQWITKYAVAVSTDNVDWRSVEDGKLFSGPANQKDTKIGGFKYLKRARYVRVMPLNWKGAVTGRFGVLCATPKSVAVSATTKVRMMDVPYTQRTASSVSGNAKMGVTTGNGYGRGMLTDSGGWRASANNYGEFYTMDLGSVKQAAGVVTKGNSNWGWWVKEYNVFVSQDNVAWTGVDLGKIFAGNRDKTSAVETRFSETYSARYVRIMPVTWQGVISMRAAVLVTGEPEVVTTLKDQHLAVIDVGYTNRAALGTHLTGKVPYKMGEVWGKGMLSDSHAWYQQTANALGWYSMDLGTVQSVGGIAMRGRSDSGQWVKNYHVTYSRDGKSWQSVEHGRIFPGAKNQYEIVTDKFKNLVQARYVKIHPNTWQGAVTGRFGVVVARPSDGAVPSGPLLVVDVPYTNRKASSVSGNKKMGEGYGRGMLTDSEGWRASANNYGQSYTMDLGELKSVAGVVTKGVTNAGWWVKTFEVFVSADSKTWRAVDMGKMFSGNTDQHSEVQTRFGEVYKARYVRIAPTTWQGVIAMRAAVMIVASVPKELLAASAHLTLSDEPYSRRSALGTHLTGKQPYEMGVVWGKGMLSDTKAWYKQSANGQGWYAFDLGRERDVGGIAVRARPDSAQWITKYAVAVSTDNVDWRSVEDGKLFSGPANQKDTKIGGFKYLKRARYVRVMPLNWKGAVTGRFGVLCATPKSVAVSATTKVRMMDVPYTQRTASSVSGNAKMGVTTGNGYGRGMLTDSGGWRASANNYGEFYTMDLGSVKQAAGVVTKGNSNWGWWVKEYNVFVSQDNVAWTGVDLGKIFAGNRDKTSAVESRFSETYSARYVRIMPVTWQGVISMRAAVLVTGEPEVVTTLKDQHLAVIDVGYTNRAALGTHLTGKVPYK